MTLGQMEGTPGNTQLTQNKPDTPAPKGSTAAGQLNPVLPGDNGNLPSVPNPVPGGLNSDPGKEPQTPDTDPKLPPVPPVKNDTKPDQSPANPPVNVPPVPPDNTPPDKNPPVKNPVDPIKPPDMTDPKPPPPPVTDPPDKKPKDPPPDKGGKSQNGPNKFLVLDDFGNPLDKEAGLAKKKEFQGKRILVWCGSERDLHGYFNDEAPNPNPMWAGLREKGFTITRRSGPFPVQLLKDHDQLWIISSPFSDPFSSMKEPSEVAEWTGRVVLNPGESRQDWELYLSHIVKYPPTRTALQNQDFVAIAQFVASGKGLFLMADNEPYTVESNVLAQYLFRSQVKGNYQGTRIAYVADRTDSPLTPQQIEKFGGPGAFAVKDHALLTGVNFIYEGITVSHFTETPALDVVLRASDGQPVIGVAKQPGQRVVLDCGCTRYYYGPAPSMHYITKTAGTVRFAENVAAYLMGKGKQ
jgi:hypothetical protein